MARRFKSKQFSYYTRDNEKKRQLSTGVISIISNPHQNFQKYDCTLSSKRLLAVLFIICILAQLIDIQQKEKSGYWLN